MIEQLNRARIPWELRRGWVQVGCCFHQHSGRQKLLGFSGSGGMYCWSCRRRGHWNHYASRMGLEGVGRNDPRLHDIEALLADHYADPAEPTQPQVVRPWDDQPWRGLPGGFLRGVPSYRWFDDRSEAPRILWPVYCGGRFYGCTAARLDNHTLPKTRNLPGLDAAKVLWPLDHPVNRDTRSIVLVEGQFDALTLLNLDIPAVSVFGTGGWNPAKLRWLRLQGIERLILCFDGDPAGHRLTDEVAESAADSFAEIIRVGLPAGTDPGDCPAGELARLSRLTQG